MSQCFREADVHFSVKLPYSGQGDTTVHNGIAVRANGYKVAVLLGNRGIFCYAARRQFRGAAADAIEFPGFASSLVFCTAGLQKCLKVMNENQHGAYVIGGSKPFHDPVAHGVFMVAEEPGDLFHGIASMDFYEPVIEVAFAIAYLTKDR